MRHVRASSDRRVAAAVVDVTAGADTAADGVTVASEEDTDEFANNDPARVFGQGWIRTSEGVKPTDLQSAPFGHFGTYPFSARDFIYPPASQLATRVSFRGC